jgi:hypothetical protein
MIFQKFVLFCSYLKTNFLIDKLLSSEVQSFIHEHALSDPHQLLLKYKTILGLPASLVIDQVIGKKKAKQKFPSWFDKDKIIYPPSVNLEQASSEEAGLFKANKIKKEMTLESLPRLSALDLSGGFGVDSFCLSGIFKNLFFLEPNKNLLDIVQHNHDRLGVSNIEYLNVSAESFLSASEKKFDFIYVDPSRRTKDNRKLVSLEQCDPNIISCQNEIWKITDVLLVKTSPLLDISKGTTELRHVAKVIVLSIGNECKELLFLCKKQFEGEPIIEAVNIDPEFSSLSFTISEEQNAEISYSDPLKFIYEPHAAILKSGGFKMVAKLFHMSKLHPNTHLYTSDRLIENFPGRVFDIEASLTLDRNTIKKFFPDGKANVTTRNYPLSPEELKKKAGLTDGGEKYLIGLTASEKKILLVAKRIH